MDFHAKDENRTGRICYIIEAALEYFISLLISGAYLARITSALGFSDSLTGILSSFLTLSCLFQLGSIVFFKNVARVKKPIIFCHLANQSLFALVYLIPVLKLGRDAKTLLFILCFCGGSIISKLIASPKVSWLRGLVPDKNRGSYTATLEIVSLISGMIFTFIAGSVIDGLEANGDQRLSFIIGSITIAVLMVLHTISLLPVKDRAVSSSADEKGSLKELAKNKMYLATLPIMIVWNIASCCAIPFFGAYQIKELGFSMTFVSVISIISGIIRALISPYIGKYADRHSFIRMVLPCFMLACSAFIINSFTVPANGKILGVIYNCLLAVSQAGIGSALSNMIFDHVKGKNRISAISLSSALGGVCGFLSTCVMSLMVTHIQNNGNRLFGIPLYPTQFAYALGAFIVIMLMIYIKAVVIPMEDRIKAANTNE